MKALYLAVSAFVVACGCGSFDETFGACTDYATKKSAIDYMRQIDCTGEIKDFHRTGPRSFELIFSVDGGTGPDCPPGEWPSVVIQREDCSAQIFFNDPDTGASDQ